MWLLMLLAHGDLDIPIATRAAPTASPSPHQHLRFLNTLRFGAALWVLTAHCSIWGGLQVHLPDPQIAVAVFMILSGFLIKMTFEAREPRQPLSNPRTWFAFYLRRICRLAPLYYLCLLLAVANSGWFLSGYQFLFDRNVTGWRGALGGFNPAFTDYSLGNLAFHATFLYGLSPRAVFSTMFGDWSLSLEMQFYLVFPALLWFLRRSGYIIGACSLVCCGLLARHLAMARFIEPGPLPFLLNYFLIGMLLHEATNRGARFGLLAIAFVCVDYSLYDRGIVLLLLVVSVIWALSSPRSALVHVVRRARRYLETRLFDVGAEISYGIYLTHGFFISCIGSALLSSGYFLTLHKYVQLTVMTACVLVPTLALSLLLHIVVERPGITLGTRLARRVTGPALRP